MDIVNRPKVFSYKIYKDKYYFVLDAAFNIL